MKYNFFSYFFLSLLEPNFIRSFDVDDYVLFFVKEKSLEQIAEGQDINYARVFRVCKVRIPQRRLS